MAKGAKTFKGIAKRVRTTATGKLMHGRPFSNHFMSKKRASRKRTFAHMHTMSGADTPNAKRLRG
jgi:large subunit ribosomal protein L35